MEAVFWQSDLIAPALLRTRQAFEIYSIPISESPQVSYTVKWYQRLATEALDSASLPASTLMIISSAGLPDRCLLSEGMEGGQSFMIGIEMERLLGKVQSGVWKLRQSASYTGNRIEQKGTTILVGALEMGKSALGVLTLMQSDDPNTSLERFLPRRVFPEALPVPLRMMHPMGFEIDSLQMMQAVISSIVK